MSNYRPNLFRANRAQLIDEIPTALLGAKRLMDNARWFREQGGLGFRLSETNKLAAYAFLNRACELTCVPLAQYYADSPSGLDLVWITYRPEAVPDSPRSIPDALVYLDSVNNMTEHQARARALGY